MFRIDIYLFSCLLPFRSNHFYHFFNEFTKKHNSNRDKEKKSTFSISLLTRHLFLPGEIHRDANIFCKRRLKMGNPDNLFSIGNISKPLAQVLALNILGQCQPDRKEEAFQREMFFFYSSE